MRETVITVFGFFCFVIFNGENYRLIFRLGGHCDSYFEQAPQIFVYLADAPRCHPASCLFLPNINNRSVDQPRLCSKRILFLLLLEVYEIVLGRCRPWGALRFTGLQMIRVLPQQSGAPRQRSGTGRSPLLRCQDTLDLWNAG